MQALGSSGFLDFVIHSPSIGLQDAFSWGVELLRDSSEAAAHAQRVAQTGIYAPMMSTLTSQCLVDFWGPTTSHAPTRVRENFWYVKFDHGFSHAFVTAPGGVQP